MKLSDLPVPSVSRRSLLIGGGVALGLVVAWEALPRRYALNLATAPGEHVLGGYIKVAEDGRVTVVVPQVEMGQGVYTTLPQIVADELGADWRTVGVEPAPINALYANTLFATEHAAAMGSILPQPLVVEKARRVADMVTGGSTTARGFEAPLRHAAAAARALLCMAAAKRWDADWQACDTAAGFVTRGNDKLRFGVLAAEASRLTPPDDVPWRVGREGRLVPASLARLDAPAKIDGSANFAADIRLPGMQFASMAAGPVGNGGYQDGDEARARRVRGVRDIVRTRSGVAVLADNWWAADQGLQALQPRFETGTLAGSEAMADALDAAFAGGKRMVSIGDVATSFTGATVFKARYQAAPAPHVQAEPSCATASLADGQLQLWAPTQAPTALARAVADATGISFAKIIVHPAMVGGSFGRRYLHDVAVEAALLAQKTGHPVQLILSRRVDIAQDAPRPPAIAEVAARLDGGRIDGWQARIASPSATSEVDLRCWHGATAKDALTRAAGKSVPGDIAGAVPPYAIANVVIDHHPAAVGVPSGELRGGAHGLTAFFTESFIDELAGYQKLDPFSFRMAMLGDNPRLAFCLSKVTTKGNWQGGIAGSNQGLACHSMYDSHIAVLAEARIDADRVRVAKLFAVADVGRVTNPAIVRQQIIGGLIMGMATATGAALRYDRGAPVPDTLAGMRLPTIADMPVIDLELIIDSHEPGGAGELGVPAVAPAIANALFTATGRRYRNLPLLG